MKKKIAVFVACILAILGVLAEIYLPDSEELQTTISEYENTVVEIIVSEETQEIANETIEATVQGEDLSTTEETEATIEDEQLLEEELLETDAVVEQENISYDGDSTGEGLSLLGAYQGLTYYSQLDSRWSSIMYSSTGNKSQTIGSSGCGPTTAAMVVSSSKGTILPTAMASLAVDNGYRTANNGTAWAYYSFIADYFDFEEYYSTSNYTTALNYLKTDNNNDGVSDYFIIVSCGSGLFTTSGHYIVLVGDSNGTLQVYDPYLYSGKFTTASRKNANVTVSNNTVYVTESNFKKYANAKNYWVFSNDEGTGTQVSLYSSGRVLVKMPVAICCFSGDYALVDNYSGYQFWVHKSVVIDGYVYGLGDIAYDGGSTDIVQIFSEQFWCKETYMSDVPTETKVITYSTNIGSTYRLKSKTTLYSNSNLTGTSYNYLANTQIKVISHVSENVDYVYVVRTGRYAYCEVSKFN